MSGFGWCGSAIFGGWLADKYDYSFTFLITAFIQAIAVLIWFALISLVPKEEERINKSENDDENDDDINDEINKSEMSKKGREMNQVKSYISYDQIEVKENGFNQLIRRLSGGREYVETGRTSSTTSPLMSF